MCINGRGSQNRIPLYKCNALMMSKIGRLGKTNWKKCEWLGQLCASLLLVQRRDWQRARVVDWKCQKLKPKVLSQRCSGRMRRGWVWKPKSKRRKMKRMKREWMNQGPNMNVVFPNLHLPGQVALNNAVGSVLHQLVSSLSNFYVYCLPHLGTMM